MFTSLVFYPVAALKLSQQGSLLFLKCSCCAALLMQFSLLVGMFFHYVPFFYSLFVKSLKNVRPTTEAGRTEIWPYKPPQDIKIQWRLIGLRYVCERIARILSDGS
jgi:hypothetical protein